MFDHAVALQTEALHKKLKEEEAERRSRESAAKHCDKQWLAQSNKVLAEKEARLAEKRRHSMERKKSAVHLVSDCAALGERSIT